MITQDALHWKRKRERKEFFAWSAISCDDACHFAKFQTEFFIDTNNNMCMLLQCKQSCFPNVAFPTSATIEIFQGFRSQKRPFFICARLKIDKYPIYIARVPHHIVFDKSQNVYWKILIILWLTCSMVINYSFYVVLKSGFKSSFSFLHCLEKTTMTTDLKPAFRSNVQPQILQF